MQQDVYINALGTFLPGPPVSNAEMEDYLGRINGENSRNRAPVLRQNKIKTRHYAVDKSGRANTTSAQMASNAIKNAAQNAEISLRDISYLATSSTLGDILVPGLASHVHAELGLPPIEIANFQSVCASSLMALKSAWLQLKTGQHQCAAVSGSELASRYFQPGFYECVPEIKSQKSIPLDADFLRFTLSDGAGAAILENRPNTGQPSLKILWIDIRSYADRFDTCMIAGGVKDTSGTHIWSHYESPVKAAEAGAFILRQDFSLMHKMIPVWVSHYLDLIDQKKIVIEEIDYFCSHYSSHSLRVEAVDLLKKSGALIDEEKWFTNLYTKGNTGTASIFIILEELYREKNLQKGQKILCHVPESGRAMNGLMLLEVK
ncbi:MAG: beta-ketoacyl-ACP synthase III [Alphaproteobacteria bacterium]|nr:beta-ketoacyl-ACP synthase III [Alphaproteobacteria bacterium]